MGRTIKPITRREMVKNASLLGLAGAVSPLTAFTKKEPARKAGLIEIENSKPGTLEWQLQYTRFDDPITLASNPLDTECKVFDDRRFCFQNQCIAR